jgi:hypothetical protein
MQSDYRQRLDRQAQTRSEFFDEEAFAIAGGAEAHAPAAFRPRTWARDSKKPRTEYPNA